jgi:DNA-binding transcriptional regulator YdaS (Cro superfamily)
LHPVRERGTLTVVSKTNPDVIEKAALAAGGVSALASAIGVSAHAPYMWRSRRSVPAEYCPAIERATKGVVRCEDLRPDVAWSVVREAA